MPVKFGQRVCGMQLTEDIVSATSIEMSAGIDCGRKSL